MSPFYTGKGDKGTTGSLGAGRLSKDSLLIEAVGSIDEVSAMLGFARSLTESEEIKLIILQVQKQLYILMAELSLGKRSSKKIPNISIEDLTWMERQIEDLENKVRMPDGFILPGESQASASLAVARTIVRRAERRVISYFSSQQVEKPNIMTYLNRLSSLIFILEIYEISISGLMTRMAREA
jgi:cob(I)alamin adenosyltransferase